MADRVFADLREEYAGAPLDEAEAGLDPLVLFARWFDQAVAAGLRLANGMTLATVASDGRPSARIVLLKGYDPRGFVFYSNYDSRKGRELAANPHAALLFWWQSLERQIRIEGAVEQLSEEDSDAYFATRPLASNLSAIASPQSRAVPDRQWLVDRVAAVAREQDEGDLVRPENWGGLRLRPSRFEFWQGRPDRLHDRLVYERTGDSDPVWQRQRLAP
ncbi:MAG: pyridoxamine 5'-phosphate oxidase [Myxococcota bacterium]